MTDLKKLAKDRQTMSADKAFTEYVKYVRRFTSEGWVDVQKCELPEDVKRLQSQSSPRGKGKC